MSEAWLTHRAGLARKGNELREARTAAGLTLFQLCDVLEDPCRQFPVHTNPAELSRIETGQMVPPAELGLALSLWMHENRLQTPDSVEPDESAPVQQNRRFDTPAAVQPDPVPSLFDAGLAPVPVAVPMRDTIGESFEAFHQANPWVMDALVHLARDMRESGRQTVGIAMLWEVLRWQHTRNTRDGHSEFKLNNSYRAHYARRIMDEHPDLAGIFNLRKQTSL